MSPTTSFAQRAAPPALEPLAFSDLPGWDLDDFCDAWPALLASARAVVADQPVLRKAVVAPRSLRAALAKMLAVATSDARQHLVRHWQPHRVLGAGFVTAYYEPCVDGALAPSSAFAAPILARPADLDTPCEKPYPDRRAIVGGAIATQTRPIVWLRDSVEVFLVQVQGSARVRLPDGGVIRLVYDGRNGRPYTSIGRELIARGAITADGMSLAALKAWLRANGAGAGGPADDVMALNQSYVFFRADPLEDAAAGPIGGQGVPLTTHRSLAVDRTAWSYGLPFWVNADLPAGPFARLMVAQDTGSAIVGPARADLFFGAGEEAGRAAGDIRHPADLFVLLPKTVVQHAAASEAFAL